jgi:hypothetical protein
VQVVPQQIQLLDGVVELYPDRPRGSTIAKPRLQASSSAARTVAAVSFANAGSISRAMV